jgi:endonuclease/exonuclease/phosphatase family metal-dependent hydrolase
VWLVGLGLAAAALWSWRAVPVRGGKPADRPGRGAPDGRAATWLVLGPVLLLWGVVGGLPSRLVAVDGIGVTSAVGLHVLLAAVLLPVMLWSARRRPGVAAAGATAGAVLVAATGTDGALVPAAVTLVGVLLLLGGVLGAVTASTAADPARQAGRGRAAATGAGAVLLFAVLGFVVYAAYDIDLGISGDALLRIACLLCLPALLPLVRGPVVDLTVLEAPAGAVRGLVAAATALALLTSAGAALSSRPQAPPPSGGEAAGAPAVRVLLYNVHMGFDTRGRFVPATLADVIRAELPDVVVLNEIDRGWMLDGGHDLLGLLASRVGLPHVAFAPAADEVWGNAVLSRYPISSQAWAPLPLGGVPMRRSAMELTLETPHGPVAIVATHLHHLEDEPEVRLEQARSVAAFVGTRLPGPVVVAGDLNAVPGAPELAPLEALVTDLTGTDAATYPSWDPQRRIDHVLGSPGLAGVDASVPASEASDHLGVAVTVLLP